MDKYGIEEWTVKATHTEAPKKGKKIGVFHVARVRIEKLSFETARDDEYSLTFHKPGYSTPNTCEGNLQLIKELAKNLKEWAEDMEKEVTLT